MLCRLDIEHTDRKQYFTWDGYKFPTPVRMQEELARTGRKMVTIIDPHLKAEDSYPVYAAAKDQGLLVRDDKGEHFHGDCWPGRYVCVCMCIYDVYMYTCRGHLHGDCWSGRYVPRGARVHARVRAVRVRVRAAVPLVPLLHALLTSPPRSPTLLQPPRRGSIT